ncbi:MULTISPECIES: IclR family transcriptional regulator [Clavibacter]|uniref:IclR family transcriptional regulator n=2 Tax=Clavibacter TaxID=1573 RepID=A0A399NSU0_9MICO|nr:MULTISPECIES: IclR family transcriptional regulator [Clavibacter]KDP92283.1 IclR family transcriptional regulator [Clavibacter cf. michiganensis LMG 26808]MBF4622446.1 IclR family transcriptional regulator [Clavibacter sp. VKM Ac-2542]RII96941.1 IclR family transcriptional regulator [Clavibacter michiganensis]UKF24525.1 IclR family transcriptional regulator [Clavibacter sp. A6099]
MVTEEQAAERGARPVKSAERTLALLERLAASSEPVSVVELHRASGYPRSSLHQLLHTMAASGWIEMLQDGTHVSIGSRALVVGTAYLDRDRALPHALAALERIRDETGYTAHYARREGDRVLYLATRETTESRRATSRVGRQLPAHATSLGKALLAELSAEERREALGSGPLAALTPQTVTDPAALDAQLDVAHERGYAHEREENLAGVSCVAVSVGYRIPATDAISCSMPIDRATPKEAERVARIIGAHADRLAQTLRSAGVR